jgi:hypothetical protein
LSNLKPKIEKIQAISKGWEWLVSNEGARGRYMPFQIR